MNNEIPVVISKNESKFIFFSFMFFGGTACEDENTLGLSHLLEHILLNMQFSLSYFFEEREGSIRGTTSREYINFTGYFLKEEMDIIFPALLRTFFEEELDIDSVNNNKMVVECEIEQYKNSYKKAYFEKHSMFSNNIWENDILGSIEKVSSYKLEDIRKYKSQIINFGRCVLALDGDVDYTKIRTYASKYRLVSDLINENNNIIFNSRPIFHEGKYIYSIGKKSEYHDISIIYCLEKMNDELLIPSLAVFNAMLTAMNGSLLMKKLREEKKYVYQVISYPEIYYSLKLFKIETKARACQTDDVITDIFKIIDMVCKDDSEYKELFNLAKKRVQTEIIKQENEPIKRVTYLAKKSLFNSQTLEEIEWQVNKMTYEKMNRVISESFRNAKKNIIIYEL